MLWVGIETDEAVMENWTFFEKLKLGWPYGPPTQLLGIYSRIEINILTRCLPFVFMAPSFTVA